jgi:hypothetical protein
MQQGQVSIPRDIQSLTSDFGREPDGVARSDTKSPKSSSSAVGAALGCGASVAMFAKIFLYESSFQLKARVLCAFVAADC